MREKRAVSLLSLGLAAALACGMFPAAALAEPEGQGTETPPIEFSEPVADAAASSETAPAEGNPSASEDPPSREAETPADGITLTTILSQALLPLVTASANAADPTEAAADEVAEPSNAARSSDRSQYGLTVTGGTPGKDFYFISTAYDRPARSGAAVLTDTLNELVICGDAALTISNDDPAVAANATVWIAAGTQARISFDNVNINSPIPVTIERNRDADGNTVSPQTSLWLTLAKGSSNTLTATANRRAPAIRCGEGTSLTIDDDIPNIDVSGNAIAMNPAKYPGRIPDGVTFKAADGKTYTAGTTQGGSRLNLLESDDPGSLTATGGILAAGIGGGAYENAGRMVFNGGNLNVTAIDGSLANGMGAGIGGGHGSCGTYMEFNGGRVE